MSKEAMAIVGSLHWRFIQPPNNGTRSWRHLLASRVKITLTARSSLSLMNLEVHTSSCFSGSRSCSSCRCNLFSVYSTSIQDCEKLMTGSHAPLTCLTLVEHLNNNFKIRLLQYHLYDGLAINSLHVYRPLAIYPYTGCWVILPQPRVNDSAWADGQWYEDEVSLLL